MGREIDRTTRSFQHEALQIVHLYALRTLESQELLARGSGVFGEGGSRLRERAVIQMKDRTFRPIGIEAPRFDSFDRALAPLTQLTQRKCRGNKPQCSYPPDGGYPDRLTITEGAETSPNADPYPPIETAEGIPYMIWDIHIWLPRGMETFFDPYRARGDSMRAGSHTTLAHAYQVTMETFWHAYWARGNSMPTQCRHHPLTLHTASGPCPQ